MVSSSGSGNKEQNQKLTKVLGISPKRYAHILKGKQFNLWIKGKEEFISKLCNVAGHWSPDKTKYQVQKEKVTYLFSQHYQKYNKKVSNTEDIFAKQIIFELNA